MKNKSIIWEERGNLLLIPKSLPFQVFCEKLLKFTCEFYDITKERLLSKTRKREVVEIRQFCQYITFSIYDTPTEIARFFGRQNHATPYHSRETVLNLLDTDPEIRDKFLKFNNTFVEKLIEEFPQAKVEQNPITSMEIEVILTTKGKSIEEISTIKNKILDELLAKLYRHPDHVPPSLKDVLF